MEDHKELFYMKLLEYEENLPMHYDKEKWLSCCYKRWGIQCYSQMSLENWTFW